VRAHLVDERRQRVEVGADPVGELLEELAERAVVVLGGRLDEVDAGGRAGELVVELDVQRVLRHLVSPCPLRVRALPWAIRDQALRNP
jgi:hypothetical protein